MKTGRNLAIIIESAAMNFRAQTMGYDATKTFDENLNRLIQQNSERDRKEAENDWKLVLSALNPIALQFGPFTVHWYGVIIASGVVLALWLSIREGARLGLNEDVFYDYLLCALPVAIICARTYYVTFEWQYYSAHPSEIIAIWDGELPSTGPSSGAF